MGVPPKSSILIGLWRKKKTPNLVGLPNQIWPILRVHWLLPCLGCPVSSSKPKKTTFKTTTTNSHRSPNLQNRSNSKILEITIDYLCINQGSSRLSCGKPNVVPKGARLAPSAPSPWPAWPPALGSAPAVPAGPETRALVLRTRASQRC